ncbi:MAG: hypothetical protein Q9191_005250 [Dirinaria sp. TL-2023a]
MAERAAASLKRPQLTDRNSSSHSISRASPSGLISTSQKGSSQRLHKMHAVGHGRHPHGRVPSYGKNLNRLPKQGLAHSEETPSKHHVRRKSQTPPTSPVTQQMDHSSSYLSLPRTGSKASMKKSSSGIALQHRDGSAAKLGKGGRSEKVLHVKKGGDNQRTSKAQPKFSVGSDCQDEEWTEESPTPEVMLQAPIVQKLPQPADLPSPDDPPGRSPPNLPHSPPQSPPAQNLEFAHGRSPQQRQPLTHDNRPPNAGAVTSRILSKHNATPHLSSISATITPTGSNASPAFAGINHGSASNPTDPSLPPDGISRFLHPTGSSGSGSAASASISHLQSTLAALHQEQHRRSRSPTSSPPSSHRQAARRAQSAANLTHSGLNASLSHSSSPPSPRPRHGRRLRASPFDPPTPKAPSKSMTQLKLDLQRMNPVNHDAAKKSAPTNLLGSNSQVGVDGAGGTENQLERRRKQYAQAERELRNAQRFEDVFAKAVKRLETRGLIGGKRDGKGDRDKRETREGKVGSVGKSVESRPSSRGRVRFEVGRGEEDDEDEKDSEHAMLRRMWVGDGVGENATE